MRTIWAVSEYYQPNFSGAAIQAQQVLSEVVRQSNLLRPVVFTMADHACRSLAGQTRSVDGVAIRYVPVIPARQQIRPMIVRDAYHQWRSRQFQKGIMQQLRAEIRPGDVLLLYIVDEYSRQLVRLAHQQQARVFIQVSLVGSDDPASFRPRLLGLSTQRKRRCFDKADGVIALSQALVQRCRIAGVPEQKIHHIPNGVDVQRFQPGNREAACRELSLPPQRQYIAFVGAAIFRKGIDVAIEAFVKIASELPNVDLLIIGPSNFSADQRFDPSRQHLIERLQELLRENQIESRVRWVGSVENVPTYLQAASVFLFPTRREGLPNALAEAMASRIAVVTAKLEGITTDLIHDHHGANGIAIDGHEANEYAQALRRVCGDNQLREQLASQALSTICDGYCLTDIAARYVRLMLA